VPSPLLGAVADLPEEALLPYLQHLQRTEFLYEARLIPAAVYTFKHALTREVAYQSLLTNTRQAYHQRIAQIFESHFSDQAITQPALVAYHYTEAGSYQPAINAWHRAGEHALQRGAYHEAREHLRQGLALLQTLPESCERTQGELNLCLVLGPILMLTQGASAPEVEHVYTRAYALCQEVEETPQLVAALRGLQHFYRTHGQLHPARALGERLLALAQSRQDAVLLIEAYMSLGATLLPLGAFGPALTHLEHGLACRGPALSLPLPDIPHPVVGCLLYSGLALWYLGYPEQARMRIHEGLAVAQQLVYPHHLGWSQHLSATFSQLCRDVGAVQALVDTVVTNATEQGWQLGLIEGQCLQGWVLAQHGRGRAGIDRIEQGLTAYRAGGGAASLPRYLALLAEAHGSIGQTAQGLAVLTEAHTLVEKTGERAYAAEIYRLQGELLLAPDSAQHTAQQSRQNVMDAEACFYQALDMARQQGAKSLELRTAMRLSRLWQQQGKRAEAHQLLAEVYGWFTEGFDTADLQAAKTLLEE
jgi:tetratricopeptide (TPR) repeat protein